MCIVVNVIFMAMDSYEIKYDTDPSDTRIEGAYINEKTPGMSYFLESLLVNGNYFFTAIFAIESFAKLAAMSPRYFFAVSTRSEANHC